MFLITTMSLIINLCRCSQFSYSACFFAGYGQVLTFIINIDCSLDQNQEADKWLFVFQPWMEKNEKYFGVRGFIPFDCSTLG
jgi:hypothetical protein